MEEKQNIQVRLLRTANRKLQVEIRELKQELMYLYKSIQSGKKRLNKLNRDNPR